MTYERKRETYKTWQAVEAGIMEDVRRHTFANEQIAIIQANSTDAIETGVRLIYPVLACITPPLSFDDFISLPGADADQLIRLALAVNPSWDNAGITEKKSANNPPSGINESPKMSKTAKKRHSYQPK